MRRQDKMPARNKKNFRHTEKGAGMTRAGVAKKIMGYKEGGKASSAYHTTKDGRRVKKGLYYYMNKRKKAGTSRKGTGTVSAKALKRSAKTAKKP